MLQHRVHIPCVVYIFSKRYLSFAKISDSQNLKRQHSQYDLHNCNLCNWNFNYLNRYADLPIILTVIVTSILYINFTPNPFNSDMQSPRPQLVAATNRYRSIVRCKRRKFGKDENSLFHFSSLIVDGKGA